MGKTIEPKTVIRTFLDAVESRDAFAVAACFSPNATYQNVPHTAYSGRDEIEQLFAPILSASEQVKWDVLSMAIDGMRVHLERVDRFWISGKEYSVECHGVITVDATDGLIVSFLDYLDLGEWRAKLGDVLRK